MQLSARLRVLPPAWGADALSALRRSPRAMSWILCEVLGIFLHLWRAPTRGVTALPGCAAVDPTAHGIRRGRYPPRGAATRFPAVAPARRRCPES